MTPENRPAYRPTYKALQRPLTVCGVDRRLFFLALLVGLLRVSRPLPQNGGGKSEMAVPMRGRAGKTRGQAGLSDYRAEDLAIAIAAAVRTRRSCRRAGRLRRGGRARLADEAANHRSQTQAQDTTDRS